MKSELAATLFLATSLIACSTKTETNTPAPSPVPRITPTKAPTTEIKATSTSIPTITQKILTPTPPEIFIDGKDERGVNLERCNVYYNPSLQEGGKENIAAGIPCHIPINIMGISDTGSAVCIQFGNKVAWVHSGQLHDSDGKKITKDYINQLTHISPNNCKDIHGTPSIFETH